MHESILDTVLWGAGFFAEMLLAGILIAKKTYRTFPLFTVWVLLNILSDLISYFFIRTANGQTFAIVDFTQFLLLFVIELSVLGEIAVNVIRPARGGLTNQLLLVLLLAVLAVGVGGFLFAAHANTATFAHPRAVFVVNSSVAILQLLTFLLIAGFAQLLGLGWKNRTLQIASGLAFYAAVSLIATSLQNNLHGGPDYYTDYHSLSQFIVAGSICSLYYWCFAFVRKEAPRKEFSPQMAQFLVSITGSTKTHPAVVSRNTEKHL
jgi:hypothetical protein